jgi:para-nitrobenzyl esterase
MMTYWSNFARKGDPNGLGLPQWPAHAGDRLPVMHLDGTSQARPDSLRARYETLDAVRSGPR